MVMISRKPLCRLGGGLCLISIATIASGQTNNAGRGSKPLRGVIEAYREDQGTPKVVGGGVVTSIAAHPWQVSLQAAAVPTAADAHFCGGSIIGARWVLTAAHCVDNGTSREQVQVLSGTASLEKGGARRPVADIKVHTKWNPDNVDFDIALVQVTKTFDARSIIAPATGETLAVDQSVVVTGWGALAWRDMTRVLTLREVTVPFVSRDVCNQVASYGGHVTGNMFCAGKRQGGVDACSGDSGGPATVSTAAGRRLVGIVSWGEGCGFPNKYGVYTQALNFAEWITRTTSGEVRW
jgi:secreted trypsin-like serine protease